MYSDPIPCMDGSHSISLPAPPHWGEGDEWMKLPPDMCLIPPPLWVLQPRLKASRFPFKGRKGTANTPSWLTGYACLL